MTHNVKAFMLLGQGYSSAGQQVLNKDIEYKSYSKAKLKNVGWNRSCIELHLLKDALMSRPNCINAHVVRRLFNCDDVKFQVLIVILGWVKEG